MIFTVICRGGVSPPAVTAVQIVSSRVVEGADPYDHEIVSNPSTVRNRRTLKTVGDGALDVPFIDFKCSL